MDNTNERIYDPYSNYAPKDYLKTKKTGILYAWAARAGDYVKDPLKTYNTDNPHKVDWTFNGLAKDPMGTLIGRDFPSEEEILARLEDNDRKFAADEISKTSDFHRILPNQLTDNYTLPNQRLFEKRLTQNQMHVNFRRNEEIEGDINSQFDRRSTWDMDYILHHVTLGWYQWDPLKNKTCVPSKSGYGTGEVRREQLLEGPNIRGRYARDLRGDNPAALYRFTNTGAASDTGSDRGGRG